MERRLSMFLSDNGTETIARYYGEDAQKNAVQEECAELIQAICKDKRYNTSETRQHMVEEISDLYLTLSTLYYFLTDKEKAFLTENLDKKVLRQLRRIADDIAEKKEKEEIKCPCDTCEDWNVRLMDCTGYADYHNCSRYRKWQHVKEMREKNSE